MEENPEAAAQFHGLWVHAQVVAQATETSVIQLMMILPLYGDEFYEYAWGDAKDGDKQQTEASR